MCAHHGDHLGLVDKAPEQIGGQVGRVRLYCISVGEVDEFGLGEQTLHGLAELDEELLDLLEREHVGRRLAEIAHVHVEIDERLDAHARARLAARVRPDVVDLVRPQVRVDEERAAMRVAVVALVDEHFRVPQLLLVAVVSLTF